MKGLYHFIINLISRSDIQKVAEYFQCSVCLVCKNTFCKDFTKLNAFLVKAVYIPQESLEHNFIFEVCKECAKACRIYLLADDDAGRTSAFEVLIAIVICFTACKCNDLSCYVCTEFLLACAVLDHYICTHLVVLKSDELKRYDICSLMKKPVRTYEEAIDLAVARYASDPTFLSRIS